MLDDFKNLERDVNGRRDGSEPFRPMPLVPQAISLSEAQGDIRQHYYSEHRWIEVGDVLKKKICDAAIRIEMGKMHQPLHQRWNIVMSKCHPKKSEEGETALEHFKERDSTESGGSTQK